MLVVFDAHYYRKVDKIEMVHPVWVDHDLEHLYINTYYFVELTYVKCAGSTSKHDTQHARSMINICCSV